MAGLQTRPLSTTGIQLCEIGFGGASVEYTGDADGDRKAQEVLTHAWERGIRYYDTAPHYGLGVSERRVGAFLQDLPREDYILSTKVGRLIVGDGDHKTRLLNYSYDGIMRSLQDSLKRLGLDRVDILLVHDLTIGATDATGRAHADVFFKSGARAVRELKSSGVVSAIGLGTNHVEDCLAIIAEVDLDAILLAGRYTLIDRQAENGLLEHCGRKRISLIQAGVFNTGILATGAVPGAKFQYRAANEDELNRTREIEAICARHDVRLPAAALQFAKDHRLVTSTLLGVATPNRLDAALADYSATIPPTFWDDLAKADRKDFQTKDTQ